MDEKGNLKIMPAGDRGMVAEFGNVISIQINDQVQQLKKCLSNEQIQGVLELQPTFRSLMIYYDPLKISYEELEKRVRILGSAETLKNHKKKESLRFPAATELALDWILEIWKNIPDLIGTRLLLYIVL